MRFKNLELHGFKSFVDQTAIAFDDGITAIVGPNGCGKSNISDAIRWVIGEQRPKTLRGTKMEDFIFSGSASRKPSGYAEVSITLTDVAGRISKPELSEFNEITVTRRLYRSGESEYLINRAPCRLKDVVDLFLDTGVSTKAFSIIEQDQVQRIVTSKPEERRFIVEEAAGIMKYKNRRHQALLKLEHSNDNLERVNDIIGELQRQRNSLKRQAGKAERYKKYRAEAKQLFIATASVELRDLRATEETVTAELRRLEEVRTSIETDIASRQNQMAALQSAVDEQVNEINRLREEEYRLGSLIKHNEESISIFRRQIEEAQLQVEKFRAEVTALEQRRDSMQSELAEKNTAVESLQSVVSDKTAQLEERKREETSAREGIQAILSAISQNEEELSETANRLSALRSNLASTKTRLELVRKRLENVTHEKHSAVFELENLRKARDEKNSALLARQENFNGVRSELGEMDEKRKRILEQKTAKEEDISRVMTLVTEERARLSYLKEIESAREGFQEGTRSLLKLKEQQHEAAS